MRVGYGIRHPALMELLAERRPAARIRSVWGGGTLPLSIAAFTSPAELPEAIVMSVRCIVRVDTRIVVCQTLHGSAHAWPGGRREPGESYVQTACREVHEETGWLLDQDTVRTLGWLHLHHERPPPPDHPYPHPDFLQLVLSGRAESRDGGFDVNWSDTEGYEVSSELMSVADALALLADDPVCTAFLQSL